MVKSILKKIFRPKFIIAGLAMALVSAFAFSVLANNKVLALPEDCEGNSVVYCGFQDKNGFKADYNENKYGDLDNIYEEFNFSASDMNAIMGSRGVWGWTHRNGEVKTDSGLLVGYAAWSMGREDRDDPERVEFFIDGEKYYRSPVHIGFADGTQKIRTLILMDETGTHMVFGVMSSCGNPVGFTPPKFKCEALKQEKVDDDTYKFWTKVELDHASVKNLKYEVVNSDNEVIETINKTNPDEKITVDFEPGKYTVRVTVTYTVGTKEITETLQVNCQTEIEVEEEVIPEFACTSIKTIVINGSERRYKFVGTAEHKDAKVLSAKFDFGDGSVADAAEIKLVNANETEITSPEHAYAEFTGKKFIQLSVKFDKGDDLNNPKCKTEIAREVLNVCVPKKGENDQCVKIPETGPTEILAAAAGVSGLGAAGMYYRASRRNLSSLLDKFRR